MRYLSAMTLAVSLGTAAATEPPKFDPKADLEKLRGEWETGDAAAVSIRLEFPKAGVVLRANTAGQDLTLRALTEDAFELTQADGKTAIALKEGVAKLARVPRTIGYRFDKEALVLTFPEGGLKGEHRLTKAAKK